MASSTTGDSLPADVVEALEATPEAYAAFLVMPPSHRRQYLEYIDEVRSPAARARRIVRALEMMMDWKKGKEVVRPPLDASRKLTARERKTPPVIEDASRKVTTRAARRRPSDPGRATAPIPRKTPSNRG